MSDSSNAPGKAGMTPRWTTSKKDGVGTMRNPHSHGSAIERGIWGEVNYPRVDVAAVRDMGLIVTDGKSYFSEEQFETVSKVSWIGDGVPGFVIPNTSKDRRYAIEKTIIANPFTHAVLKKTKVRVNKGAMRNYHLYVLISPHLGNEGSGNTGRVGEYKSTSVLVAEGHGPGLSSDTGLISKQAWDREEIPDKTLVPGRPTGSVRALVSAHAEYVKLLRSLADGKVFDMPQQTVERYIKKKTRSAFRVRRFDGQIGELPGGKTLRIETNVRVKVRYSVNNWKTPRNVDAKDSGRGIFVSDLATGAQAE